MIKQYLKYLLEYSPVVVAILITGIIAYGVSVNSTTKYTAKVSKEDHQKQNYKIDSLQNVVDSLQMEIFVLEDGFDSKEHTYEDVLFQYELGLSYLKDYHPTAYKDFHRIIGMKERYSNELNRENTKTLNQYKNK